MPSVLRILDANANRAREAIRVMEEAARFLLNDEPLTRELKTLRHDLTEALSHIAGLQANRDTEADIGVQLHVEHERRRESVGDVALAAGKRLGEALRAIEEYAKTLGQCNGAVSDPLVSCIEVLRYRGYVLEQRLNKVLVVGRARQWRVCVLISSVYCTHCTWLEVARLAWDAGADCVQLREKDLYDKELLSRARQLAQTPNRGSLIINDRPDIVLLAGADGVHLGQNDMTPAEVRRLFGSQLLVGMSTCKIEDAQSALDQGADYCGVGPMFTSTTKHKDLIVGPKYLQQFLEWGRLPHLAIGGVTTDNIDQLVEVGCQGVAVCSAVCSAPDPGRVVRQLVESLKMAQPETAK